MQTIYRLDRRFVLTSVGVQLVGAGVTAMLAFWVWEWFAVLTILLLLNAARVVAVPPSVARTDDEGVRLGGPTTSRPVRLAWADVDDVATGRGNLMFDRADGSSVGFALAYLGDRADDFVRDVHGRLNTSNGYRRFDPDA